MHIESAFTLKILTPKCTNAFFNVYARIIRENILKFSTLKC